MSSKLEEKKKQLIALLDEATSSQNAEFVNEAFGKVKKVELKFRRVINRLEAVERYLKKNNRKQAIFAYKSFFFAMSKSDLGSLGKVTAKRLLDADDIQAFIDDKYSKKGIRGVLRNLKKAHRTFSLVIGPAAKIIRAYTMICNTKETLKNASEVYNLYQAQKQLKTAKDYQQYYEKAGKLFGKAAETMKIVTDLLPRGASDYCDYILTVAANCEKAVKIVRDYTEKVLKKITEIENDNFGKNHASELQRDSRKNSPGKWIFNKIK